MDALSVQRYVDRPWEILREAKRRYWAEEIARRGPEATLAVSRALRVHMQGIRPEWPTDAQRAEDLAHHLELKGWFARAARALVPFPDR